MMQQRRFTKEFADEAVRLVQASGRTQREIAGDLGIGLSTLVRWIGRSRDRRAIDPAAAESDVTAELKRLRRENEILLTVGRRRIARLMRDNGLRARQQRRFKRTTDSHHAWPVAPNLLDQDFLATGPTVLSIGEEAIILAFRRHTLLPLDDCLYALQATIPHLTRSSLARCQSGMGWSVGSLEVPARAIMTFDFCA